MKPKIEQRLELFIKYANAQVRGEFPNSISVNECHSTERPSCLRGLDSPNLSGAQRVHLLGSQRRRFAP
jgi:hypothetical protein